MIITFPSGSRRSRDAALLELARDVRELRAGRDALNGEGLLAERSRPLDRAAAEKLAEELADVYDDAFDELLARDATTLEGLAAQAAAVRARKTFDGFDGEYVERILEGIERLAARCAPREIGR